VEPALRELIHSPWAEAGGNPCLRSLASTAAAPPDHVNEVCSRRSRETYREKVMRRFPTRAP